MRCGSNIGVLGLVIGIVVVALLLKSVVTWEPFTVPMEVKCGKKTMMLENTREAFIARLHVGATQRLSLYAMSSKYSTSPISQALQRQVKVGCTSKGCRLFVEYGASSSKDAPLYEWKDNCLIVNIWHPSVTATFKSVFTAACKDDEDSLTCVIAYRDYNIKLIVAVLHGFASTYGAEGTSKHDEAFSWYRNIAVNDLGWKIES